MRGSVDPAATDDVLRELVSISRSSGTTIFFSSHHLAEVELIADHIGIVDQGRMVTTGRINDLTTRCQRVDIVFETPTKSPACWPEGAKSIRQEDRLISLFCTHNVDAIVQQAQSIPGTTVKRFPMTLREIFLEHTRSN